MAESNPRYSEAQRRALRADALSPAQLAALSGASILPADRTVTDGSAFVADDTRVFTGGYLVDDTAPGTATEGDITPARVTPNRVQRMSPGNDAGTPATYGAGTVAATTPRITLASNDPAVVALEILDDWDEANRAAVNLIAGQVGVQGGAGLITALTQRVTLATDDELNDDVDAIRVADEAIRTAVEIIDDWDETDRCKVNPIPGQVGVQGGAGITTALTQRVVPAGGLLTLQASQVAAIVNGTTTRTTTTGLEAYRDLVILINITGAGAATGVLQLFLQDSWDGGTTWDDLVASNTFTFGAVVVTQRFALSGRIATTLTQGSAAAVEALTAGTVRNGPWGERIRVREVISGIAGGPTGPTYTITVIAK